MEVIYFTIPGMIFLGLAMVVVLIWAVRRGQYEDLDGDGQRILLDEDEHKIPTSKSAPKGADSRTWPDAD